MVLGPLRRPRLTYPASWSPPSMQDTKQSLAGSTAWHQAACPHRRGRQPAQCSWQMVAVIAVRFCFPPWRRAANRCSAPSRASTVFECKCLPGFPEDRLLAEGPRRALGSVVCQREGPCL